MVNFCVCSLGISYVSQNWHLLLQVPHGLSDGVSFYNVVPGGYGVCAWVLTQGLACQRWQAVGRRDTRVAVMSVILLKAEQV